MYGRLSWKESFWEKNWIKILLTLLIIIFFPVQRDGIITESYTVEKEIFARDLLENIDCEFKLGRANTFEKVYTGLGDTLRVIVDVASSIEIDLEIESSEEIELKETGNFFNNNITISGPSIIIKLINPTLPLIGKDAELSGQIDIFHEYITTQNVSKTREVFGKVWQIWWIKYIKK